MILFIHGFASCGLGQKSKRLIEHFGADQVLTPDLAFEPNAAITQLERLIADRSVRLLVGSSLGGYYATWLNRQHALPSVLINPAVRPWELLSDHLGTQHRWCDQQAFDFSHAHADQLQAMYRPQLTAGEQYLVLLQSEDEVLDHRQAAAYYADHQVIIEAGGNHRFENLADHLPAIDNFYQRSQVT